MDDLNGMDDETFRRALGVPVRAREAGSKDKNGPRPPGGNGNGGPRDHEKKTLEEVFEDLSPAEKESLDKIVREILPKD